MTSRARYAICLLVASALAVTLADMAQAKTIDLKPGDSARHDQVVCGAGVNGFICTVTVGTSQRAAYAYDIGINTYSVDVFSPRNRVAFFRRQPNGTIAKPRSATSHRMFQLRKGDSASYEGVICVVSGIGFVCLLEGATRGYSVIVTARAVLVLSLPAQKLAYYRKQPG
jgi:hypothetical protein